MHHAPHCGQVVRGYRKEVLEHAGEEADACIVQWCELGVHGGFEKG